MGGGEIPMRTISRRPPDKPENDITETEMQARGAHLGASCMSTQSWRTPVACIVFPD